MINFFRRIRRKLADENSFLKYSRYALGEIVLVVIGILIALQVNNWNENRKKMILKESYTKSLILDFEKDTLQLGLTIKKSEQQFENIMNHWNRINSEDATIDSITSIARYEFDPTIEKPTVFNNNTFNILVASGRIDLFESWVTEALMELISSQEEQQALLLYQNELYMKKALTYSDNYSFDVSGGRSNRNAPIQEMIWKNINSAHFASTFLSLVEFKIILLMAQVDSNKDIKLKTEAIIKLLQDKK